MAERVFALPDLGEGLEEGEIVSWLVSEGDEVELNQPLVEVETAKATVEIPSPFAGTIATLHAGSGESVAVGTPLVTFEVAGDGAPPRVSEPAREPSAEQPQQRPSVERSSAGPVAATPAVRKLAKDLGVDLGTLTGSGPNGRVTVDDVRSAADGVAAPGPAAPGAAATKDDVERIEVSPVRRTIARRLEASAAIQQVTTFRTLDATALEAVRADLDVSPLPIFVAALCRTIAEHPLLNAEWSDEAILIRKRVHAGIAVDTDRGLLVPVVRDAHGRTIGDLAAEIRRLAEIARSGSAKTDDLAGATISISNTGSYGSEAGTPLLNPPNAVTIALGVIRPRALVTHGGAVEARPACTISLTFDHRVLDGAAAGRALTDLVDR
ncbi:MAG TPA: dihydrolipoamide acetyltransferase family protein, partial [Actinomycetota bacterium]|nr:dihydrolipoamide acetyltransferase family protein [Actinomycetota bacterium]